MASASEVADNIAAAATTVVADDDDDLIYGPIVDGDLEPELNSDFIVHPDMPNPSKQLKKEKSEEERRENDDGIQNDLKRKENEDGKQHNNLKSTLLFSGVVIAVIGAIFAVVKKIKAA